MPAYDHTTRLQWTGNRVEGVRHRAKVGVAKASGKT
jgi:hypothetical protein